MYGYVYKVVNFLEPHCINYNEAPIESLGSFTLCCYCSAGFCGRCRNVEFTITIWMTLLFLSFLCYGFPVLRQWWWNKNRQVNCWSTHTEQGLEDNVSCHLYFLKVFVLWFNVLALVLRPNCMILVLSQRSRFCDFKSWSLGLRSWKQDWFL